MKSIRSAKAGTGRREDNHPWKRRRSWLVPGLLGVLLLGGLPRLRKWLAPPLTGEEEVQSFLEATAGKDVPGLQYVVVGPEGTLFDYAGGWADVGQRVPLTSGRTMMAFSMTKPVTAIAVLQLVEQGLLGLDDDIDRYLPQTPYRGQKITVRQLLAHTSGIPNPIPLRWTHLAQEDATFDEDAALADVLNANADLRSAPGERYAYSNIGYWLLGKIVEEVTDQSYATYVRANVLRSLGLSSTEMDFVIPDAGNHANGYVARLSMTNMIKGFVTDSALWGEYEGNWLRLNPFHLNGPAFGGLVGTARGFGVLLQDQLRAQSVLLGPEMKQLLETPQTTNDGEPLAMTLGWHIDETNGIRYFYKQGGGGGFRAEMRIYPGRGIGSVVMVNRTEFNSTALLNRVDRPFIAVP